MRLSEMEAMNLDELYNMAKENDIKGTSTMKKKELMFALLKQGAEAEGLTFSQGVLEIMTDGYGFLRRVNYLPHEDDIYILSGWHR